LDLLVNERFAAWHKKNSSDQRNDHGCWNGQNLLGLDPRLLLLAQKAQGEKFSLLEFVRNQTEMFRVLVRKTDFPWLKRYAALVRANPRAEKEGIAGYEIAFNYNGVPFELIPRAVSELKSKGKYQLISVNEAEHQKNPCRRLVTRSGNRWELGGHGVELLDLLTY
jgi:hypothetical protein